MINCNDQRSPQQQLAVVLERLGEHHERNGVYYARCPAHDDHRPSLEVTVKEGKFVMICRVGCSNEAIIRALGLIWPEILGNDHNNGDHSPRQSLGSIVAFYDYHDELGHLLFQVVRYSPKQFRQRRPDPNAPGQWLWNLKGVRRVPYRLRELLAAPAHEPVFVPEGEKDVENVRALGLISTTNPQGAGKFGHMDPVIIRRAFSGRRVILLPHNDAAGRSHVLDVATRQAGIAAEVRILELPGLPEHGDVSDWIAAGGTKEQLLKLAGEAPIWTAGAMAGSSPRNESPTGQEGRSAKDIILAHLLQTLQPTFRRGDAIYSASRCREVKRTEACHGADSILVEALAAATDRPKLENGATKVGGIPRLFATWVPTAWADLIGGLPEEPDGAEIVEPAREEFRRQVAAALHHMVSLGRYYEEDGETRVEHRSLIHWAELFAKPGRWASVRSYCLWVRRETESAPVQIAITVALFSQVGPVDLAKLAQRKFARMAELYDVGTGQECRAGGVRCVQLDAEFVADLLAQPEMPEEPAHATLTRENGSTASSREEVLAPE